MRIARLFCASRLLLVLCVFIYASHLLQGQMQISSLTAVAATCSSNGTVTVTVSGGTPVYCFQINGEPCLYANSPTFTFTDLTPGIKTITVTDGPNTTTVSGNIVVGGNYQTPALFGLPQGCGVLAQASGGLPPYQYAISLAGGAFSPLQNDPQFTPVLGNYCIRVYDACNNFTEYCGFIDISPVEFTAACCANVTNPTDICVSFTDRQGLHANDPGYWFGGQPPYTYTATAAGLTVSSPDGNFQLQQLCPGWSFTITDGCGNTATQTPNCMQTAVLCIDCGAGTAEISTTNGVAPYVYFYQDAAGQWQPNPAGGTSGSFTGLPPANAGNSYTFRAIDACGNQSEPLEVRCLDAKGAYDCAVQTAYIEPLTDFFPADVVCQSCPASPGITLGQPGLATFPTIPAGPNTFTITDACGATVTIECRDTLPDLAIEKSCNTIIAKMRSNYVCDDGAMNPYSIVSGVLYELALASQPGMIIASNTTGIFNNLTAGATYIVTATHGICGVASAVVTLFTNSDFSIHTELRTTSFIQNGICQTGYQVMATLSPAPTIPVVFGLTGGAVWSDSTGNFPDIPPGIWTLDVADYCVSETLELPDWKPEMTVQMPECPNGGCVQMSGARTPAEWTAWGATYGLNIISNADFYILDCPGFNGPQCVANWGGNICNLIPGNSYSVYLKPGTFTCPVDTISFIVDPNGTSNIDSVRLTTAVACTDSSLASLLVSVDGGKAPVYLEVIDSISGLTLKTFYDPDNDYQITVDSLEALKTYFFRVVDACNHTKDVTATVILLPGVSAAYTRDCLGSVQLQTAAIYNAFYTWSDGNGNIIASGPDQWTVTTNALPTTATYAVEIQFGTCLTHITGVTVPGFVPPLVTLPFADTLICAAFSIDLEASANVGNLSYGWSTGETTNPVTVSLPGDYTVIVTDTFGCKDTAMTTIASSQVLTATLLPTPPTCFGADNGSVLANHTGGTPPFGYIWENGTTTAQRTGLPAGQYLLTITDSLGCSITAQTTLLEPPLLSMTTTGTPVSCFQISDGTAQANPTGGTPGYVFVWSTGQTGDSISGLPAGTFTVTCTDNNGCSVINNVLITAPPPLSASFTIQNVSCAGGNNGSIQTIASGGTGAYFYQWSVPGQNSDLQNLTAGDYSITITDQNNCTFTQTITITQGDTVLATVTGQNITCGGGSDGSLLAPGPPDYQFLWNTGQSGPALSGLTAGTYTVTVTNSNNCTATAQLSLTQPPVLTVTTTSTPLNCNNIPDGTATAVTAGGTGTIQYLWSAGQQTTAAINTLPAGIYTVTVTDMNLCTATAETTVLQPEPLFFIVGNSPVKCHGDSTGAIDISTFGGTPGYNYGWSTGAITEDIINLIPGIYTVTITDLHGCTVKIQGIVTEPAPLLITAISSTVTGCDQQSGTATVAVTGGTPPWSALWSDGQPGFTATALGTGIFTVTVTDVNGCQTDTVVTVEGVPPIDILYSLQHISCFGASDGVVYLEGITGGAGPPYYLEGVELDANMSFVNLSAGTYTWSVNDGGDCTTTITGTITAPPPFSITLPEILLIDFGQQVLLEPQVNGFPAPPIVWQWTPSTGLSCDSCASTIAAPFQTTQYQLTGTDANGCTATDEVRINVNRNCDIYIANVFTPQVSGPNDLLIINAGICVKSIQEWQIFDRWGELVFSKKDFLPNDFSNAWDGQNRNQRLENGVYTWYARYELIDGTTGLITGDVTILD